MLCWGCGGKTFWPIAMVVNGQPKPLRLPSSSRLNGDGVMPCRALNLPVRSCNLNFSKELCIAVPWVSYDAGPPENIWRNPYGARPPEDIVNTNGTVEAGRECLWGSCVEPSEQRRDLSSWSKHHGSAVACIPANMNVNSAGATCDFAVITCPETMRETVNASGIVNHTPGTPGC